MSVIDQDQFRKDFPEFADAEKFTNGMIDFWAGVADSLLNVSRWGDIRETGIKLFVAHNIALQASNVKASKFPGGVPGQATGLKSNQSAGQVSVGVDTQASIESSGGNYNLTTYGTTFLRLSKIMGMGGLQL